MMYKSELKEKWFSGPGSQIVIKPQQKRRKLPTAFDQIIFVALIKTNVYLIHTVLYFTFN